MEGSQIMTQEDRREDIQAQKEPKMFYQSLSVMQNSCIS